MQTTAQPIYRQGDVLIKKVSSMPSAVSPVDCSKDGRVILMLGAVTGHAHAFSIEKASLFRTEDGRRFLDLKEGAALTHEEHSTIYPQAGVYEVVQQREYTPEAVRNVAD